MELKTLFDLQTEFDRTHFPKLSEIPQTDTDRLQILTFLVLGALGELGELANIIKKVHRGDKKLNAMQDLMVDEIADVFIYLIKICQQLDINLEQSFLKKLDINKNKFVSLSSTK